MPTNPVLVVDLEATCYEDKQFPPGSYQEIIEIGVCLLDTETGERSKKRSLMVKPQASVVSPFCTQLTTITQAMVDQGMNLQDACEILRTEYQSEDLTWASYGMFDLNLFQRECQRKQVRYPYSDDHINVMQAFADAFHVKRRGMARALKMLKTELAGTHHRGDDDAWNIAAILWRTLQEQAKQTAGQPG